MDISYEEFRGLSQELTDKEVCIAQLRNELEATREKLEEERLKNSVLQDENYMLKAQRDKVEFENSVLRKYILLSKEKIAEFVRTLRNINHWAFLRAFVLWALPEEYRDLEMACVDEVMGLPKDNPTGIVMNQPTFQGPMYDVHGNSDVDINR
jgi:hypothetical protein